jgi:ferric-dicitrate binding protein FerR (iron transport regulator)
MANTNGYGEDMMSSRRYKQAAMLLLGITLFLYCPLVLAAADSPRVLGTVVASGNASMKAGLDRWMPVDQKTYPVMDGTALKTEEGTTSITMKDGATIEMGKRTDLLVNGALSNYFMRLQHGMIAFKVYEGIGLSVTTPSTSVVVQRVSGTVEKMRHTIKDEISGIITHDGKDTQVYCLRGKFSVMQAAAETMVLSEGNRVAVEDPLAVTQAQAAASLASVTSEPSPGVVKAYENPAKVPEVLNQVNTAPEVLYQVNTGGLEVVSEKTP